MAVNTSLPPPRESNYQPTILYILLEDAMQYDELSGQVVGCLLML